mgnify:CR=1 FL=1
MAYAAYLRIYEPVSAFHEPDRSRWAAYATYACPRGEYGLAVARSMRARGRWRAFAEFEQAN